MLIELADHYKDGKLIKLKDIAIKIDRPVKYLAQLISPLVLSGIIKSRSGPNGGIKLAGEPVSFQMSYIMESISGKIELVKCINRPSFCRFERHFSLLTTV